MSVSVQNKDFKVDDVISALCKDRADIGAVVTFIGLVRDRANAESITAMSLEHYPGMTEKALEDITNEAQQRWSLQGVSIIHRVGKLQAGEQIVIVAAAASHRGDAFKACEFMMDYLKTKAPFWKKEYTEQGANWVDARQSDDVALARWK